MDDKFTYRFDNIDSKMDKIVNLSEEHSKILHSHDLKFAEYNALLEKHIEGVIQNRASIKEVRRELNSHKEDNNNSNLALRMEVEPLLIQKKAVQYIASVVIGLGGIAGALWSILKLMGKI